MDEPDPGICIHRNNGRLGLECDAGWIFRSLPGEIVFAYYMGNARLGPEKRRGRTAMERCGWCLCNEKMIKYHDEEWGVPVHDDRKQFEYLMMEAMQCGLNWNMMIQKREVFRKCFYGFDYEKIAEYGEEDIRRILETEGMIRSRRKVEAVIHNARCFLKVREEFGTFSEYLWGFSRGKMILYMGHQKGQIPAKNGLSDRVSGDLRKRGFKYLGSVTVYAHLQACGMVNDHLEGCFRYREVMEGAETVRKRREKET